MNENEILELSADLKNRYERLEEEKKQIAEEFTEMQKHLISIYGFIRIIDTISVDEMFVSDELNNLISILRTYSSQVIDKYIKFYPL